MARSTNSSAAGQSGGGYFPDACAGCDQLIVTGHSLGAALAVLAAPDIAKNVSVVPEPKLTTFGGPGTDCTTSWC